jgi:hypothetical protein
MLKIFMILHQSQFNSNNRISWASEILALIKVADIKQLATIAIIWSRTFSNLAWKLSFKVMSRFNQTLNSASTASITTMIFLSTLNSF